MENETQTNESAEHGHEQGQGQGQGMGATMQVDAALRRLGKLSSERAQTPHLDPEEQDPRPFWDACHTTSVQLARWARQIPKDLLEVFNATHLATSLNLLMRRYEGEGMDRQIQRAIYAAMLGMLREDGIQPMGNPFVAQALWAQLQSVAFVTMMTMEQPRVKSREAMEEWTRARRNAMSFREHLVQDMVEMCTVLAAYALNVKDRVPQDEDGEQEAAQVTAEP